MPVSLEPIRVQIDRAIEQLLELYAQQNRKTIEEAYENKEPDWEV